MRPLAVASLAVASLAVLPAAPAAAQTFEGRCSLTGELAFDPPMAGVPGPVSYTDHATGACTGTLGGEPIDAEPVELSGHGAGTLGCLAGRSTTSGTLRFERGTEDAADDVVLPYEAESTGGLTQFVSRTVSEDYVTVGRFDFLPYGDESTLRACEAGTLTSARYDGLTETIARP